MGRREAQGGGERQSDTGSRTQVRQVFSRKREHLQECSIPVDQGRNRHFRLENSVQSFRTEDFIFHIVLTAINVHQPSCCGLKLQADEQNINAKYFIRPVSRIKVFHYFLWRSDVYENFAWADTMRSPERVYTKIQQEYFPCVFQKCETFSYCFSYMILHLTSNCFLVAKRLFLNKTCL